MPTTKPTVPNNIGNLKPTRSDNLPANTDNKAGNAEYMANNAPAMNGVAPRCNANNVSNTLLPRKQVWLNN